MKSKTEGPVVRVEIGGDVLESVFDECDRYDHDETGGRIVGHFTDDGSGLVVHAKGVIEPGPNARRTSTSFFQDGDHQTEVFRRLEAQDASIEHLGNWHTHHVNGYPTLSSGDVATYRRTVNHELHNLDFFYALLVTHRRKGRRGLERYSVRHYVLFRGEDTVQELRADDVRITDEPRIWPREEKAQKGDGAGHNGTRSAVEVRARDQMILAVISPSLEPRLSKGTRTFFWKGLLSLIDGSAIEVRVVEVEDDVGLVYYPVVPRAKGNVAELCATAFNSASQAVRALEWRMNQDIYQSAMVTGER